VWPVHDHLIRPVFFAKATLTNRSYLDMLENFLCPQLTGMGFCRVLPAGWRTTTLELDCACISFLITISQSGGLSVLVPSLGQPDHQISHPAILSCGDV
jgi:hypothetical protein